MTNTWKTLLTTLLMAVALTLAPACDKKKDDKAGGGDKAGAGAKAEAKGDTPEAMGKAAAAIRSRAVESGGPSRVSA